MASQRPDTEDWTKAEVAALDRVLAPGKSDVVWVAAKLKGTARIRAWALATGRLESCRVPGLAARKAFLPTVVVCYCEPSQRGKCPAIVDAEVLATEWTWMLDFMRRAKVIDRGVGV